MALKFEDLEAIEAPSRRLASEPKNATVKYDGLSVPVKIVELEGGVKGMVTLDRFADFKKSITKDSEGYACLPASWKVGKDKAGVGFGYWYDSENSATSGSTSAELIIG